jgi:nitric oxide reductase NorE protein
MTASAQTSFASQLVRPPTAKVGHVPGEAAVWVFIIGVLLFFTLCFIQFYLSRTTLAEVFVSSQRALSINFAAVNTILLLTGSLFVVMGVHHVKDGRTRSGANLFTLAIGCAAVFGVDKVFEYSHELAAHHTATSNVFFQYYFMFTGFHALHLLIGIAFLTRMRARALAGTPTADDIRFIEVGASFWHLVDLLWVLLFPILYIVH